MAIAVVLTLGVSLGLVLRAPLQSERSASNSFDLETQGFETDRVAGRLAGEPQPARSVGEPDDRRPPNVLAFANRDVANLAEKIGRSSALTDVQLVAYSDLRLAVDETSEVCVGVSRPTATEDALDTRSFRFSDEGTVTDVRITEFFEATTVDRVLQASRSAWESCDGAKTDFGSTVERSVLSFTSLSGTPGVNLQSTLLDDTGAAQSTSQTLAIPAGNVLIEIRVIVSGNSESTIDPVALLRDVEALV